MSEKKKETVELKDEELEKVSGGFGPTPTTPPTLFPEYIYYCPYCKNGIVSYWESVGPSIPDRQYYCKHCDVWVTPVEK